MPKGKVRCDRIEGKHNFRVNRLLKKWWDLEALWYTQMTIVLEISPGERYMCAWNAVCLLNFKKILFKIKKLYIYIFWYSDVKNNFKKNKIILIYF